MLVAFSGTLSVFWPVLLEAEHFLGAERVVAISGAGYVAVSMQRLLPHSQRGATLTPAALTRQRELQHLSRTGQREVK